MMSIKLDRLQELLITASRTFALNIPMLPSPLVEAVTLGYLLFRNADTIEDAYQWSQERRIAELGILLEVVNQPADLEGAQRFAALYQHEQRVKDHHHIELLRQTPFLLEQFNALPKEYRLVMIEHISRTIQGMQTWVDSHDEQNRLSLSRLKQLEDYCYTVAGIVGEMLTSLFAVYSPQIRDGRLLQLRTLEVGFATGLQLTNIIKDAFRDHGEGRHYIPKQFLPLSPEDGVECIWPMIAYAYRRLHEGMEYTLIIPIKEVGIRKSCLLPISLAAATLVHLYEHSEALFSGADVKISRATVGRLRREVEGVVAHNDRAWQFWERLTLPLVSLTKRYSL